MEYVGLEKELQQSIQKNQLHLLEVRYEIKSKELEISRMRIRNMIYLIAVLVLIFISLILYLFYQRKIRVTKEKLDKVTEDEIDLRRKYEVASTKVKIKTQGKSRLRWGDYLLIIDVEYPFIENKLKNYCFSLSSSDIKYCICILDGKNNTEIAELLNVSMNAVTKAKKRIRDKLKVNSAAELNMQLIKIHQQSLN